MNLNKNNMTLFQTAIQWDDDVQYVTRRYDSFDYYIARFVAIIIILYFIIFIPFKLICGNFLKLYLINHLFRYDLNLKSGTKVAGEKIKIIRSKFREKGILYLKLVLNSEEIFLNDDDDKVKNIKNGPTNDLIINNDKKGEFNEYIELAIYKNINMEPEKFDSSSFFKDMSIYLESLNKKPLEMNICSWCRCLAGSMKSSVYENCIKGLNNLLEFENLLSLITDVRKLKRLLLNKDQITVFDYYYANYYSEEDTKYRETGLNPIEKNLLVELVSPKQDILETYLNEKLIYLIEEEVNSYKA